MPRVWGSEPAPTRSGVGGGVDGDVLARKEQGRPGRVGRRSRLARDRASRSGRAGWRAAAAGVARSTHAMISRHFWLVSTMGTHLVLELADDFRPYPQVPTISTEN